MRSKLKIITLLFALLTIVLVPSCFAATVLEDTTDYEEGAIIYGSTRFDMDQIITAGVAFNAGINESKVWVALGNELNELEPVTPYYYDGATWYQITSESAEEVADEEEIKKIEENLHIFFVNNEVKTVEVPFDGKVDAGSVTDGVKYDSDGKKFTVPAYVFDFEFTTDGAEIEVKTNIDTNIKEGNTEEEVKVPEIIDNNIASIGTVFYTDIYAAIEAAKAGETVKILQDIELSKQIVIKKEMTLDFNSKTIKVAENLEDISAILVLEGGDLEITGNGTLNAASQGNNYSIAVWAKETGKATIKNGTFTNVGAKSKTETGANNNEMIYVSGSGVITIEGGTFIGNTENEKWGTHYTLNAHDASYKAGTANIIVKGGTYTKFNPEKSDSENPRANFLAEGYKSVKEGENYKVLPYDAENVTDEAELRALIAEGKSVKLGEDIDLKTAIVINNKATINLNGKTLTAKTDTVGDGIFTVVTGGDLTINGEGTIDSACVTNDYSMAIWAKETGKVTINGGTFTNKGAKSLEDQDKDGDGELDPNNNELIYARHNAQIVINGGTFIGNTDNEKYGARYTLNLKDAENETASIIVKGGTFTGYDPANSKSENPTANLVAEGYKSVKEGDTYKVLPYDANNVTDEGELRALLQAGETVKLGGDIVLNKPIGIEKDAVLDLNGHTIVVSKEYTKNNMIWTSAKLTVKGNGTFDARMSESTYTTALYAYNGGDITIEDGNFLGINGLEDYPIALIYSQGNGSKIVINSGNFVGDDTYTLNLRDNSGATIVVKGGTFTGYDPANSKSENPTANLVAEGYESIFNEINNIYTVVEKAN